MHEESFDGRRVFAEFEDLTVHEFDSGGMLLKGCEVRFESRIKADAMRTNDHDFFGRQRIERDLDAGEESKGAFTTGNEFAEIDRALFGDVGYRLIDRIAATSTRQFLVRIGLFD